MKLKQTIKCNCVLTRLSPFKFHYFYVAFDTVDHEPQIFKRNFHSLKRERTNEILISCPSENDQNKTCEKIEKEIYRIFPL